MEKPSHRPPSTARVHKKDSGEGAGGGGRGQGRALEERGQVSAGSERRHASGKSYPRILTYAGVCWRTLAYADVY